MEVNRRNHGVHPIDGVISSHKNGYFGKIDHSL